MNIEIWSGLVGFFLPILVAWLNRTNWENWKKALIALASAVLGGTVTALLNHNFNGANWLTALGVVFTSSQAFYHLWWKNSAITDYIEQKWNVFRGPSALAA